MKGGIIVAVLLFGACLVLSDVTDRDVVKAVLEVRLSVFRNAPLSHLYHFQRPQRIQAVFLRVFLLSFIW